MQFSSEGSEDADGDELTFEWTFGDGSTSTEANPTHTYTEPGTYNVRLTATDSTGKAGTSSLVMVAGNTRPTVELTVPVQGGVAGWGDEIPYTVTVTDPEDATIDCDRVTVNPGIYHDEGGNAHVHPGVSQTGCSGTFHAPEESGHAKSANIAIVLSAAYTDTGGQPGSSPLEGSSTRRLTPKTIQAEHYTDHTGTQTNRSATPRAARPSAMPTRGSGSTSSRSRWGIDELTIRYAAGFEGGMVDVRSGAVDGPVVGTATLMRRQLDGLPERDDPDRCGRQQRPALLHIPGPPGDAHQRPVRPRRVHVRRARAWRRTPHRRPRRRPTRRAARSRWR